MAQGIGPPRAFFSIDGVSLNFGGLKALTDVTFTVEEKSIFSIIGPNGSGKTTLFNLIGGLYKPDGGRIIFQGRRSRDWPLTESPVWALRGPFRTLSCSPGAVSWITFSSVGTFT